MSDDTSAALIASLDVKFDQLAKNMKTAIQVFNDGGRKLEKRQAQVKKNLSNWAVDFSGLGGINKALVGLTAAGAVTGIGALVKSGLDAASAIGDVAQQAGVGVEFLQKLRFAASQSGATFDIMDTALTKLNKTFGDFVNTGAGRGADAFKKLGIDKLINSGDIRNAEQLFDVIVKKVSTFGSEAQKSSFLASVFGKEAGPKLLQLVNQGSDGLARLEQQAISLGIVLSAQTVQGAKDASDKLDALFNVIKAEGISAVGHLAPQIANLAQEITDGIPDLLIWVEQWASFFGLIDLTPVQKARAEVKRLNDELDDMLKDRQNTDGVFGFLNRKFGNPGLDARIQTTLGRVIAANKALSEAEGASGRTAAPPKPQLEKLTVAQTEAEKAKAEADAKKAQELADHRKELLAQTGVDAATARAAMIVAQDQTNVQLLKGAAGYYSAVKKQIEDEYTASVTTAQAEAAKQIATLGKKGTAWKGYAEGVANINQALTDKIAAAAEEQKQKLDAASPLSSLRETLTAGDEQVRQLKDQAAAHYLVAGSLERMLFLQHALDDARQKDPSFSGFSGSQTDALRAQADAIAGASADQMDSFVTQQAKAYERIDELRQQDLLSEQQAADAKAQIDRAINEERLNAADQFFGNLATLSESKNKTLAAIGKAAAVAQATIDGILAVQKTLATIPPPYSFALAASIGAATAVNIAKITGIGFEGGGFTGPGARNQPAGIVHAGEVVFSQDDVRRWGGPGVVDRMRRRGYARGGIVGTPAAPLLGPPQGGGMKITIKQQPGVAVEQVGLSRDEVVFEARRVLHTEGAGVIATNIRNPNGAVAKANRDTIKAGRRRQ